SQLQFVGSQKSCKQAQEELSKLEDLGFLGHLASRPVKTVLVDRKSEKLLSAKLPQEDGMYWSEDDQALYLVYSNVNVLPQEAELAANVWTEPKTLDAMREWPAACKEICLDAR